VPPQAVTATHAANFADAMSMRATSDNSAGPNAEPGG
jgi:hypothetical protein